MFNLLAILAPICIGLGIVLFLSIRKVFVSNSELPLTADWIDALSADRCCPMFRLLDGRDLELLRAQPGFTPEMERTIRLQHSQMFHGYLQSLTADFQRVCAAIKLLLVHSGIDRSDLASNLLQSQIQFAVRLVEAELAVCLYRYGLGNVNITALMRIFDTTRIELRTLVPSML